MESQIDKKEIIENFLNGRDPMEKIISIECDYNDDEVSIIYYNSKGEKRIKKDDFKPFIWAKNSVCVRMFDGDRKALRSKMNEFGIGVRALKTKNDNEDSKETPDRLENGYKYIFFARRKMNYQKFLQFFKFAGTPIYDNKKKKDLNKDGKIPTREFLAVTPIEQYMIQTGRRMFKGFDSYDQLKRLQFDLETQGLDPNVHSIDQIGIRTNKGFEKIITIEGEGSERDYNELKAIIEFVQILAEEKPDVIAGHNSENFDWNFIIVRCQKLGTTLEDISLNFFKHPIYKKNKETVLKLGGEVEYYKPTIMWGHNIVDSLHAVRRAQAIDSSMKLANLKYVTKYLKMKKDNRVYVPGQQIGEIWRELNPLYAFNNENGDWYKISEKHPLNEGYEAVSGRYIVERYLLDDIWETDKVELKLNESNFLIGKMLPTTFQRACTMGTAGIWKLILLAWCYERELAIPAFSPQKTFTGGLSRLLKVGYADNVVKLDYNSLYPSIILTWNIKTDLDITDSMVMMLEYVLTEREKYKELKGKAGKNAKKLKNEIEELKLKGSNKSELESIIKEMKYWESEESANDKKQLPLKILGNSFFGSYGGCNVFPFGDTVCAEKTTCIGRMSLRLMISHFTKIGYTPIVGDSVTEDTPLFIKYDDDNMIDIKSIGEIFDINNSKTDIIGREYDYSKKNYKVLCRSGWSSINYVYRHGTSKPIYEVKDDENNIIVEVTEDHSLFDENRNQIKPSEINEKTKLEYYGCLDVNEISKISDKLINSSAKMVANGTLDRIPCIILNSNKEIRLKFLEVFNNNYNNHSLTKVCLAGLNFIKR